jgi:arginyl-tRNA synthetase
VSANPTGPLHVGHARQAAYGDSLARLLEFRGFVVTREYYINDYGSQVVRLAESVRALALGQPVADDGYKGDYVATLVPAERALELDLDALGREATDACLMLIRTSLERFRVHHDIWFSERSLHDGGAVDRVLGMLAERGAVYTDDGALWLRTSAYGDDKDRVLVRSSGEHTYFTSDIAYLEDKRERAYDRLIYVWGADHHGYIARLLAACEALGGDPAQIEIVIQQFVHLIGVEGRTAMSKREGEYVTLDDLVAEIGVDAARFFLLARSHDTTVDLDLDLAVRQSGENPVYYVQYAHARIASMLARAGATRVEEAIASLRPSEPLHASERALIKRLAAFPTDLADAAERRAPHRVAGYALELAQDFTAFYRDCRVVGAEPRETESWRVALALVAQRTIATALDLLGVSAPEQM